MWGQGGGDFDSAEPITPSDKFLCTHGWVSIRSESSKYNCALCGLIFIFFVQIIDICGSTAIFRDG